MALKTLFLSALFLCGNGDLFADTTPVSYADAQDQLAWLSLEATVTHKALKEKIKEQSADYEVLNRLRQAKISVEEMIQRDNVAKACKVVDLGFTAAGVVTGGAAVAAKEGGRAAFNWIAGKIAVEGAKEAAGVPGYSDAVKVGAYILNKAGQDELAGQLSKDNLEILTKAQQLIQDDSDGKTLKDKLPELRQMIFAMESGIEKNDYQLKYLSTQMDELKKRGDLLNSQAKTLKEKEAKEAEKTAETAKKAEPANLIKTEVSKAAEVPPAAVGPKDTPEETKRKVQESLDKYINSLRAKINTENKAADDAWASIKKPQEHVRSSRLDGTDLIKDLFYSLAYLEGGFTEARTYLNMQSIESSARSEADFIGKYREQLESYKAEIKARMEPIITNISGYIGQWKSVRDTYGPRGFYVSEPEKVTEMNPWNAYYEPPLKYIEVNMKGTEGLEARFRAVSSKAAAQKDAIYAEAKDFLASYTGKLHGFRDYKPQTAAQLQNIMKELSQKAGILAFLPNDFVNEFSYNGKYDLADLEAKVAAARPAFSAMQSLVKAGTTLYYDLYGRYNELNEMNIAPLMSEARTISYMAENKVHKETMASALKKTDEYSPEMSGTGDAEVLSTAISGGAGMMFGAEDALRYLKSQNNKLVSSYEKAISEFKSNSSKDLSDLEKKQPEKYAAEIRRMFEPLERADEEKQKIIEEVLKAPLFGTEEKPLLERTGFWTKQAEAKRVELEKIAAALWESPQGKRIIEARRLRELQASRETSDPGLAAVRKLYEGFEQAYENRNAAKLMSFISDDWSAGDGTTASDLNEQFTRIFRLFDEISVQITNLQVTGEGNNMYTAFYNIAIRSKIYRKVITREETSSVYEHLEVNGNIARIKRTETGGYWTVK